jgi:hypothetical protein
MPHSQQTFFDFFSRPEQVRLELYQDQLGAHVSNSPDAKKYQNLFCDVFGHHVLTYLDTPSEIQIQLNDQRRFVSSDSLTSYFLDHLYKRPLIYENPNSDFADFDPIPYDDFFRSVTDTPITGDGRASRALGSNRLSYVVGEIGTGKSLFLTKLIRDVLIQQKHLDAGTDTKLVPIYFDFEVEMKGSNGQLLDIDDSWFAKLSNSLLKAITDLPLPEEELNSVIARPPRDGSSHELEFINLVRAAYDAGLRILLVLDNIDGYHYYYSKYTFFDSSRRRQIQSVKSNIHYLSSTLTAGSKLGLLGMSVLIAARRYVYSECINTVYPETNSEFTGRVYQLSAATEVDVISSRMELLDKAIREIESNSKLKKIGADYKKTLERIGLLLGLDSARDDLRASEESHSKRVISTIRKLCHHGNRGLVTFFSNLRLDYREQTKLIERFFWDKPHSLTLLYIADLRKRYSQAQDHFPNLFLVDALVQRDDDFPEAHQPHVHTYWLKYLLLAYMNSQKEGIASEREIKRVFVTIGDFEDALYRLALGSLATSREFGCLEPQPAERHTPRRICLTSRGRALLERSTKGRNRFCFTFSYLQLLVDDYLVSYPKTITDRIYFPAVDLGYLFAEQESYARRNRDYLAIKMKAVLTLVKVLEESYKQEEILRAHLFRHLKESFPDVLVDFRELIEHLFYEFEKISTTFVDAKLFMDNLKSYWHELGQSNEPRESLASYFERRPRIEG